MALRKPRLLDETELMDYAVRLLGGAAHSSGEVRERLRRRAAQAKDVDAVLGRLKDLGYLNDRRFAETWAASRLENEGHGRARVLRDLRQRRVAPKVAEDAVRRTFAGSDETALVEQFLARKFRGRDLGEYLGEEKNLANAFRRLRYAGFSAGTSIRVLKRYARNDEVLDTLESDESAPSDS
ncbi:MAG TPA: regulatory protein RecX [Bryobacteraceae bacterium]|jgi:regulatory protein|nr:regulatory protein RecX [Bryobacteraceae bacterium]